MTTQSQKSGGFRGWVRRSNKKLLLGVLIVLVVIGVLMATSLRGALTYYKTIDELQAVGTKAYGQRYRISGRVQAGTIVKDASNNLSFTILNITEDKSLPIQYRGIVPDIFGDNTDVIIEGKYQADGVFHATNLLTQHPPEFKVADPSHKHPGS